jgi:hypothetical protein
MNANPRPRLVCRVARLWHSTVGSGNSGHVATCPDCRRYFGACDELESALRRDATPLEADAPVGLENRIMRAIAAEARPEPARARPAAMPRFALLGTAAAAAIALAIGLARWWPQGVPQPVEDQAREIASLTASAETFSDEWLNTKLPEAGAAAVDNPLREELDSVYADARSALDFLAMNFLPSTQPTGTTTRNKG